MGGTLFHGTDEINASAWRIFVNISLMGWLIRKSNPSDQGIATSVNSSEDTPLDIQVSEAVAVPASFDCVEEIGFADNEIVLLGQKTVKL